MAEDLLRIEPFLLPRNIIVVDGRTANTRFLLNHFYRNWTFENDSDQDFSILNLDESPLGRIYLENIYHGDFPHKITFTLIKYTYAQK